MRKQRNDMQKCNPLFLLFSMWCVGLYVGSAMPEARLPLFSQEGSASKKPAYKESAQPRAEFHADSMGEMKDADGVHLGFTAFKASDGTHLTVLYGDFADSA